MFDDPYGLTGKPFPLTPDPAFYFRTASHRKAQSCLGYGLAQDEGFIVITGEAGLGKSTLVAHLRGTIDPQQVTAAQVVTDGLEEADFVPAVAQAFGLDVTGHDKTSALGSIESFLHGEVRAGRRCLLIVDDAQTLTRDALDDLRVMSGYQFGSRPVLQTLLLGQPEFLATLQRNATLEPLRQRVIAAHHLEPMTRTEIEPYIAHRLERVGWSGSPQFDQRVFAELHAASAGVPLRVNQVAGRLLLLGAVERRSRIDAVMLKAVLDEIADASPLEADRPGDKLATLGLAEAPSKGGERQLEYEGIAAALADRDAGIAELREAVAELADQQEAGGRASDRAEVEAFSVRVAAIEARLDEQERALRRTLAMLIDWIDRESEQSRAA
jgi:general secretion pathway protein A